MDEDKEKLKGRPRGRPKKITTTEELNKNIEEDKLIDQGSGDGQEMENINFNTDEYQDANTSMSGLTDQQETELEKILESKDDQVENQEYTLEEEPAGTIIEEDNDSHEQNQNQVQTDENQMMKGYNLGFPMQIMQQMFRQIQTSIQTSIQRNIEISNNISKDIKQELAKTAQDIRQELAKAVNDTKAETKQEISRLENDMKNIRTEFRTEINASEKRWDKEIRKLQENNSLEIQTMQKEVEGLVKDIKEVVVEEVGEIKSNHNILKEEVKWIKNQTQKVTSELEIEIHKEKEERKTNFEEIQRKLNKMQQNQNLTHCQNTLNNNTIPQFNNTKIESLQFYGSEKNPMEKLNDIERAVENLDEEDKLRYTEQMMQGPAKQWFKVECQDLKTWDEFKKKFKDTYWNQYIQQKVKRNIEMGKYDSKEGLNKMDYIYNLLSKAKYLEPEIPEMELIVKIANHFGYKIRENVLLREITTTNRLIQYIQGLEGGGYWYKRRDRLQNNQDDEANQEDDQKYENGQDYENQTPGSRNKKRENPKEFKWKDTNGERKKDNYEQNKRPKRENKKEINAILTEMAPFNEEDMEN